MIYGYIWTLSEHRYPHIWFFVRHFSLWILPPTFAQTKSFLAVHFFQLCPHIMLLHPFRLDEWKLSFIIVLQTLIPFDLNIGLNSFWSQYSAYDRYWLLVYHGIAYCGSFPVLNRLLYSTPRNRKTHWTSGNYWGNIIDDFLSTLCHIFGNPLLIPIIIDCWSQKIYS